MFQREDIERLAKLSRLAISEAEAATFAGEIDTIVGYVSEVRSAPDAPAGGGEDLVNVMRPDENPHETGIYMEDLLASAPKSANWYVVVKKILS